MHKPYQQLDFYLLIPCYNNMSGLIKSLQSISYDNNNFKILIIDDGSIQIITIADLLPYIATGLPIEIINLPKNSGITKALNTGLELLETKNNFQFVARLDCGDICAPERFYKQVNFLQQNPQIDLVGSWCIFKNFSTGLSYQYSTPTDHKKIISGMYFRNIFIHPTVMWRRNAIQKTLAYPEQFPHAEDYGFFYSILNRGKCAVIAENLVTCEINGAGISLRNRKEQLKSRIKVVNHFGKNKLLSIIGVLKLRLLITIPYPLILHTKKLLYG